MFVREAAAVCFLLCGGGLARSQDGGSPTPLPFTTPESCGEAEIFLSGNLSCVSCAQTSTPAADGLSCECSSGAEAGSTPECAPCTEDEVVSPYCVECVSPLVYVAASQPCSACNSTLQVFLDALPSPPSSPPPFTYYDQHFTTGVGLCRYDNQEACQLLINLCVLQRYRRTDPVCEEVLSSPSPLLRSPFYPRQGADEALADMAIRGRLHTSPSAQGPHELPLVVASFALNGTFLGLYSVSDQLLICRDLPSRYDTAWRVGVQYEVHCIVGVASLSKTSSDPIFYDLYLRDQSSESDLLRPIPVLPDDYVDGDSGEEVNVGEVRGEWQLVTRFFLSEGVSSSPRYARDISLRFELESNGRVFTPFLHIDYAMWEPDQDSADTIRTSFSVCYSQDVTSFNVTLSVFVVVLATLACVVCGLRVNGFLRRSGDLCCAVPTYIFTLAEFCGIFSSALFVLLSFSCTVILILYKGQTLFVFTLPTGSQLLIFQLLLPLALLCRATHTVYLIWCQCSVDIFLIDWERSKGVITSNQNPEQPSVAPPTPSPVSIWRTYFVANEWNELQSLRRGSPLMQLFIALLILQVAGLRHLAEHTPTGHVTTSPWQYSAPHSLLLRFSLTVLVFISLAIAMRLYMVLVYERFFEHKIHQFVDLCSVSNVSVFIMWRRCYGYYIEGRSVHGRADTDMREMNVNLRKEQEDMCGRRGLMPDSDLQTFQIALTRQFHLCYDQILIPLRAERSVGRGQAVRGGAREGMIHPPARGGASEASITAYEHMNRFLSAFISHNLRDLEYTTKSKVLVERLLDLELHSPVDRSLFYEDPAASFSRLLFYGQEWSLWQLEVLVFAFIDMLATDYVLAAITTFTVAWCLSLLRDVLGRRNIKRKTLVDERFLI